MADRYWVGGSGTWNTTSTTNWSASSGGPSGASVPTAADSVFFDQAGTYTVTMTGALTCLSFTVSAGTVTFATGTTPTLAISGSMSLVAGTVWTSTGAITFNSTSTGRTVTTNGTSFSCAITFNGVGGGWTLGSALTTAGAANPSIFITNGTFNTGNFNVTASGGFIGSAAGTRTVTLGSSTITCGFFNNPSSGLTFNAGTSTLIVNLVAGNVFGNSTTGLSFNNVTLNVDVDYFINIVSVVNLTINNISSLPIGVALYRNTTVTGTLTMNSGSFGVRVLLLSSTPGTQRTLTVASANVAYADFQDIVFAGAASPLTGTSLGDCKNNSGITFTAAKTVYWNLAGTQNWNANGWAASSGASPAASNFPLPQDTAVFDNAGSVGTVTINNAYNIGSIDMSARTSAMTLSVTGSPDIYGSWTNGTGTTLSGTSIISFTGRGAQSITSSGKSFTQSIYLSSLGGTLTLQDALTISRSATGACTIEDGTLNLNGKTLTLSGSTGTFRTLSGTKNITFNGGSIVITASGTTAFNNSSPANFTTTAGTGIGSISMISASAKTFVGGGSTYNCSLNQGGAGTLTITGSNVFTDITNTYSATGAATITFTAGTTQTVSNFTATGTVGKVLTINSSSAGSAATLSKASGTVSVDYMSIRDSTATGGASWYAGANSTNVSGNTGWIFTAPPSVVSSGNFLFFMLA